MVYHGENAVRADQRPLTWMGRPNRDSRNRQDGPTKSFHACYSFLGPSKEDLARLLYIDHFFNKAKQVEVERKSDLMRYTSTGEGCRLLERDGYGRTSSFRPGRDARQSGTATNAIEAAEANKFYPHQDYKIMNAAMLCGPRFPEGKPKLSVTGQAFSNILGTQELLDKILNHLCYTDRASLFQTCAEVALATSELQTVWIVNDENLGDAEFRDEEFKHVVEAGEKWDVEFPRGAKTLLITMSAGEYQSSTGFRPYSSYMRIASGMLRLLRAIDNTGHCVQHMTLKNVPFLDHRVLAGIVEACPNLQKLEVPGCEQFTLFSVEPFLKFLKDIQSKRGTYIYFDVAPTFYKGVRWMDVKSNQLGKSTRDRKGTFGVTESDPGCDIPLALCKVLLYHILPAMKAAGQLHMMYEYSSLFRQWTEALPAPRSCIAMIIAAWEVDEATRRIIAAGEEPWQARRRAHDDMTEFQDNDWPLQMKERITRAQTVRHWIVVRATCGENGWKQTADRGFYSCDYQCTAGNFLEHSEAMICDTCELGGLPRILFNACETCEGCRLRDRVLHQENDHLQHLKAQATEALGYGTDEQPFRTNSESNFPFDAFKPDENGSLPVKTRADFVHILDTAPTLRGFIDLAAELEVSEHRAEYRKGRKTIRQLDNPYADPPRLDIYGDQLLDFYRYRRGLTHEEYAKSYGMGWEPSNKDVVLQW